MKTTFILLGTILLSFSTFSQELKGKARKAMPSTSAEMSAEDISISYGTVEAYDKENNLIRSVLTDEDGNYNLKFSDTGTYTIKIKYAGYEPMVETVKVKENKDMDFALERDYSKKERSLAKSAYTYAPTSRSGAKAIYYKNSPKDVKDEKSEEGLTAGEINDFAKWEMWDDIIQNQLINHQAKWQLRPAGRYVVQAVNEEKKPLVGAFVELINDDGAVIWNSITDNTGKAELWSTISKADNSVGKIKLTYGDFTKILKKPTSFKEGINYVQVDKPCDISNNADIAFVVDATGSMADEINFIKRDLNKVIYNTKELFADVNIRFGSVFYRDHSDAYLTKHSNFTSVLSEALVYIDEQGAAGGGDAPEAVDDALEVAIDSLDWSEDARAKIIFLILDAPAHSQPQNINKIHALIKKASKKGIKIIPVTGSGIDKSGEYLTRAMALGTNGKYIFLTNHSGIGYKHIEPNTDEYDVALLANRLTETIEQNLYYPSCNDTAIQDNLNYPDSAVQYQSSDTTEQDIKKIEWNFYPNPTTDLLTVEVSETVDFIYLTDLSGKILEKISFSDTKKKQISLIQYPTGLYLLRYPVGKQWLTGKVILTR